MTQTTWTWSIPTKVNTVHESIRPCNCSHFANGQWSTGTEISSRPGPGRDSLHPGRDRDRDKNKIPAGTGIRVIPAGTGNFASKIEPFLTYRTITTFHEFMQFEIIHVRYIWRIVAILKQFQFVFNLRIYTFSRWHCNQLPAAGENFENL